ncbi:MAG: hypothetical protein K6B68_12900 [Eubacterium sp.]|nr:hypothetical protein [Eubacterium sp.]
MSNYSKLGEFVSFNVNFKSAINLYLSLNKPEKIKSYIPTKSSVKILRDYLYGVFNNHEQATLLIGPYGKGKSHLFLVVISILSLERNEDNYAIIRELEDKINDNSQLGIETAELIESIWNIKPMLPVLVQDFQGDLKQSFLSAMNEALKREELRDLFPDTYYSYAIKRIEEWKNLYPDTYSEFIDSLDERGKNIDDFIVELKSFSRDSLDAFMNIYPAITSGSTFNPMVENDVLPLYKNISEKLVEDYDYSGVYIVFDEFSKFLEGQDETKIGSNMKFLQDICELACDSSNAKIHITMIAHKSIKEYGKHISKEISDAFTGIEGRIVEKYFITSSKNNYELIKDAIVKKDGYLNLFPSKEKYFGEKVGKEFYDVPFFKSNFEIIDFKNIILEGCYPLNPIGAYLLLNISEKVAQNERTLFTFISNDESNSMYRFVKNHNGERPWIVGVELIYDYFSNLFKKEVINELVHSEWLNAEYAIGKCTEKEQIILIKALALFLIIDKYDELPATEKLLSLATGLPDAPQVIKQLEDGNVIYRKGATNSFVFKTRAGAALKNEIKRQRATRGNDVDYNAVFTAVEQKKFFIPQRYNTNAVMTRYFRHEYLSVDAFMSINTEDSFFDDDEFCDGKVISLYSFDEIDQDKVKKHYKKLNSRRLVVVCPDKTFSGSKQSLDLEIVMGLRGSHFSDDNEVMMKELPLLEEDLVKQIRNKLDKMYLSKGCLIMYLTQKGQVCRKNPKSIDEAVNLSCEMLYTKTPIINNELINRRSLTTGQTKKTRGIIIDAVLKHEDNDSFFSGTNQEATIYRALFVNTGLSTSSEDASLQEIVKLIDEFISSASGSRVSFRNLVDLLVEPPYGMRLSVLPLYFSWILARRKEDIVMYFNGKEVAIDADIIVNAFDVPEDYELFVSKDDVEKEKYISELNNLFSIDNELNLSENRIKNIALCMQRWFRALPQVTRNFSDVDGMEYSSEQLEAVRIFKNLLQKFELNPYELLFVQLPDLFADGKNLKDTYSGIDEAKTLLDDYYDWIIEKAVEGTYDIFGRKRKDDLYHILKNWYDEQSEDSKKNLLDGRATNLMSFISSLNIYNDKEIVIRLVKTVTDVYIDNWNIDAYSDFVEELRNCKQQIESIHDGEGTGKYTVSFYGRDGEEYTRNYEWNESGEGSILKNIIEDALDEYADLSANDRVSILLEMIEKIIK